MLFSDKFATILLAHESYIIVMVRQLLLEQGWAAMFLNEHRVI